MDLYEANLAKFLNHRLLQAQGDLFLEHQKIIEDKQHELEENEFNRVADDMEKAYIKKNEDLTRRVDAQLKYMKNQIDEKNKKALRRSKFSDEYIISELTRVLLILTRLIAALTIFTYALNYIMYDNPDPRSIETKRIHEQFFQIPLLSNIFGPSLFTISNFSNSIMDYGGVYTIALTTLFFLILMINIIFEQLERSRRFNSGTTDGRLFKTDEARALEQTIGEKSKLKKQLENDNNAILTANDIKKSKEEALLRTKIQPNGNNSINVPGTPNYTMNNNQVVAMLIFIGLFIAIAYFNDYYTQYFSDLPIQENLIYFKLGCFAISGLLSGILFLFTLYPVMFRTNWFWSLLFPAMGSAIGICIGSIVFNTPLVKDELTKKWSMVLTLFMYTSIFGTLVLFTQKNEIHSLFKGMDIVTKFMFMCFILSIFSIIMVFSTSINTNEGINVFIYRNSKMLYILCVSIIGSIIFKSKPNQNIFLIGAAILTANIEVYIDMYEEIGTVGTDDVNIKTKTVSSFARQLFSMPYLAFVQFLELILTIEPGDSKIINGKIDYKNNTESSDTILSGLGVLLIIISLLIEKKGVSHILSLITLYFITDKASILGTVANAGFNAAAGYAQGGVGGAILNTGKSLFT